MADARRDNTQLVCTTEPVCRCAGEEYSCDCTAGGVEDRQCLTCEAFLIRINVETGEEVAR